MYLRPLLCLICMFIMVNIADAAPFAYITDAQSDAVNKLSVIDTATNSLVKAVNITDAGTPTMAVLPYGVAINPAGTRVYISNQGNNTISVIDSSTPDNNIIATITRTKVPGALAVNPAGSRLFVANPNENTISVLDITTDTPAEIAGSPFTSNNGPAGFAIKPGADNNTFTLYVTASNANVVSVFDVTPGDSYVKRASDVAVGGWPVGIAYANGKVFVANGADTTVSVFDATVPSPTAVAVSDPLGTIYAPIAVVADGIGSGAKVYVSNNWGDSISIIDVDTATVTGTITGTSISSPWGIALNPANTALYVSNAGLSGAGTTVTSYATGTGSLLGTINVQKNPQNFGDFIGPLMHTVTTSVTPTGAGVIAPAGGTVSADGRFYLLDGSLPTINFTAAPGFSVSAVNHGVEALGAVTTYPYTAPVTADDTFSATFVQTGVLVTVTKTSIGGATGTVTCTSSAPYTPPTSINCGSNCSAYFPPSTATINCTATPDGSYVFSGWSGACTGTGACSFSQAGNTSATLDATFSAGGPIKVIGTGAYPVSIQAAYNSLTASDTISIINGYAGTETLDFSKTSPALVVELIGGATSDTHPSWSGTSTIGNSLNIGGNTTVNIQNQTIAIQ